MFFNGIVMRRCLRFHSGMVVCSMVSLLPQSRCMYASGVMCSRSGNDSVPLKSCIALASVAVTSVTPCKNRVPPLTNFKCAGCTSSIRTCALPIYPQGTGRPAVPTPGNGSCRSAPGNGTRPTPRERGASSPRMYTLRSASKATAQGGRRTIPAVVALAGSAELEMRAQHSTAVQAPR